MQVAERGGGFNQWARIEQRLSSFVMNRHKDCAMSCYRAVVELSSASADAALKERSELDDHGSPRRPSAGDAHPGPPGCPRRAVGRLVRRQGTRPGAGVPNPGTCQVVERLANRTTKLEQRVEWVVSR